jgi:hypothetical protein
MVLKYGKNPSISEGIYLISALAFKSMGKKYWKRSRSPHGQYSGNKNSLRKNHDGIWDPTIGERDLATGKINSP